MTLVEDKKDIPKGREMCLKHETKARGMQLDVQTDVLVGGCDQEGPVLVVRDA